MTGWVSRESASIVVIGQRVSSNLFLYVENDFRRLRFFYFRRFHQYFKYAYGIPEDIGWNPAIPWNAVGITPRYGVGGGAVYPGGPPSSAT